MPANSEEPIFGAAWRSQMDQAQAAMLEVSKFMASYYLSLIENGMSPDGAAALCVALQTQWMGQR